MRCRIMLRDALLNLRAYKLQSILTMLGVTLGCAALCANQLLGITAEKTAQEMIGHNASAFTVQLPANEAEQLTPFTWSKLAQNIPVNFSLAPMTFVYAQVIKDGAKLSAQVLATTPSFAESYFPSETFSHLDSAQRVCWVGSDLNLQAGQIISIGETLCQIEGVLPQVSPSALLSFDVNRVVLIPFNALPRFWGQLRVDSIWGVTPGLPDDKNTIMTFLDTFLGHHYRHFLDGKAILKGIESSVEVLRVALSCLGWLAMAVGMFNLLNLLLMMTSIRRAELGIRQVIGATPRMIAGMLLIETTTLITLSAIVGIVGGVLISQLVCLKMGWSLVLGFQVLGIIPLTWLIGFLSVLYPLRLCYRQNIVSLLIA